MKITDVQAIALRSPEPPFYLGSRLAPHEMSATIVKTFTDEGITGIGGAVMYNNLGELANSKFIEACKPYLIGQDPSEFERIWQDLWKGRLVSFLSNPHAISAIEMSLWDAVGKAVDAPVCKLLGGAYRKKVRTYITPERRTTPHGYVSVAKAAMKAGFDAIKLELGYKGPEHDVESVKALRQEFGDELDIAVDLNSAYNRITALKLGRQLEKYDLMWIEEPLEMSDVEGLAELAATLDVPIAGGESEYGMLRFCNYLKHGAYDIITQDAMRCGGVLQAKKIAVLAEAFRRDCVPHGNNLLTTLVHLQLAASCPNMPMVEYGPMPIGKGYYGFFGERIPVKDGFLDIPSRPGIGVELDEEMIKKYRM